MIDKGAWQTNPQPKLPYSLKDYVKVYQIGFEYQGFKFLGDYIYHKNSKNLCWFIYPYYGNFKKHILIFSDKIKLDKMYQRNLYDITIKNNKIQEILNTFRETNIFYANDLTGTDFKQAIDFTIKK